MNDKTRLQLLRALHRKHSIGTGSSGFTLVELMIVVAVVGILTAAAIPAFLRARDAAAVGAALGEAVGLAKECATSAASDISVGTTGAKNLAITATTTNCVDGGTLVVDAANFSPALTAASFPAGIRCIDKQSASGNTKATIGVGSAGTLTCAFGA